MSHFVSFCWCTRWVESIIWKCSKLSLQVLTDHGSNTRRSAENKISGLDPGILFARVHSRITASLSWGVGGELFEWCRINTCRNFLEKLDLVTELPCVLEKKRDRESRDVFILLVLDWIERKRVDHEDENLFQVYLLPTITCPCGNEYNITWKHF